MTSNEALGLDEVLSRLSERFTSGNSVPVERAHLTRSESTVLLNGVARLRAALEQAGVALDDWTNAYAPELCDPERVVQTLERLGEYGTLGYIACVRQQVREALGPVKPDARTQIVEYAFAPGVKFEIPVKETAVDCMDPPVDSIGDSPATAHESKPPNYSYHGAYVAEVQSDIAERMRAQDVAGCRSEPLRPSDAPIGPVICPDCGWEVSCGSHADDCPQRSGQKA